MPRFVILAHDWPTPHFDLLLEAGPVLQAWRLLAEPAVGVTVAAEPNSDHRLVYLEYEGPLSGDRGAVTRWDAGTYEGELRDEWTVTLHGIRVAAIARLRRSGVGWVLAITSESVDCLP